MFKAKSIYDIFSPVHTAWLHRRDEKGLDVTGADLESIETHFPDAMRDPLFVTYQTSSAAGTLKKRRGRKPVTPAGRFGLWHARFEIEDRVGEIRKERRSGVRPRQPFEECPIHQAAEEVARKLRYGSGRSLLNRLSKYGVS
jgi:hypothetical protein